MLSEDDIIVLENLRKRQSAWPRFRWFVLISSLCLVGAGLFCVATMFRALTAVPSEFGLEQKMSAPDVFGIVEIALDIYTMLILGVCLFVYTLQKWRGDRVLRLLLKILENEGKR